MTTVLVKVIIVQQNDITTHLSALCTQTQDIDVNKHDAKTRY